MKNQKETPISVPDIINEVCCDICENYCKYPDLMKSQMKDIDLADAMLVKSYCDKCPLNRLQ